jgi:prolipoprotein diacylglyceryltransferase
VASFIGILLFWFLIFFIIFVGAIFWVWMFIDSLTRENYKEQNDKVVWVIVLLLTSILGAILYYFLVKRRLGSRVKRKKAKK